MVCKVDKPRLLPFRVISNNTHCFLNLIYINPSHDCTLYFCILTTESALNVQILKTNREDSEAWP
jgi:hypothetical protein